MAQPGCKWLQLACFSLGRLSTKITTPSHITLGFLSLQSHAKIGSSLAVSISAGWEHAGEGKISPTPSRHAWSAVLQRKETKALTNWIWQSSESTEHFKNVQRKTHVFQMNIIFFGCFQRVICMKADLDFFLWCHLFIRAETEINSFEKAHRSCNKMFHCLWPGSPQM